MPFALPLVAVLQGLVVVLCLGRAVLVLAGVPLSTVFQLGLLIVCAMYATTEAYWSWHLRQQIDTRARGESSMEPQRFWRHLGGP